MVQEPQLAKKGLRTAENPPPFPQSVSSNLWGVTTGCSRLRSIDVFHADLPLIGVTNASLARIPPKAGLFGAAHGARLVSPQGRLTRRHLVTVARRVQPEGQFDFSFFVSRLRDDSHGHADPTRINS
jgi:hypothetical protein